MKQPMSGFPLDEMARALRAEINKLRGQVETALGEADKIRRSQIDLALRPVLEELENNNRLETRFDPARIDRLFDTLRKVRDVGVAYNFLIDLFSSKAQEDRFLAAIQDFKVGRQELLSMYYAAHSVACILSAEQFKLLFLFMITGVHKVSDFHNVMREVNSWPKLEPFVDNEFRNALAHGTYMIQAKKIVLFKNAKLDVLREMTRDEFVMAAKNENILFWCLLLMFLDRMTSMYSP